MPKVVIPWVVRRRWKRMREQAVRAVKKRALQREQMPKRQRAHILAALRVRRRFARTCEEYRPLWEQTIAEIQREDAEEAEARWHAAVPQSRVPRLHTMFSRKPRLRSREAIEEMLAQNAESTRRDDDAEMVGMMMRTTIIVAALTVVLAVFALRPSSSRNTGALIGIILLVIAVVLAGVAFYFALKPLAPPFKRAWKSPYDKRAYKTSLERNPFTRWVYSTWLSDRRTPIITAYKKAHSVAAPLLALAVLVAVPGLALSMIYR